MIYSNSSTKEGIVEEIDFYASTNSSSYPIEQKTRNVNRRLDEVVALILGADGRWEWDDSNQTDLPIGTATLVDNQQDYNVEGATFLEITRVEVLNINGNYQELIPMDQRDIRRQALSEFQKTAGMPRYYDKMGDSIFLYPKPSTSNVTAAKGLQVYFKRVASYFTTSDTTKVPGFAPTFHRYLSVGAALDYAEAKELTSKINILVPKLLKLEQSIIQHYSQRSKDEKPRMRVRREDYGELSGSNYNTGRSDKVAF